MKLHELRSPKAARKRRKRVGRGIAAGQGKTAGRGTKGQASRSGGTKGPYFEGGQLPLVRRLPYKRGFTNIFKKQFELVNVGTLNGFPDGDVVDVQRLKDSGIVKKNLVKVKILGNGELTKKLKVKAHKFSALAASKITAAGGEVEVVDA